ncbi:MAG: AI-2E family transporter [Epulopiscium sp.]|nr:AI-2E family transporter [Candidatus Epulonipiscium sp.]
MIKVKLPWDKQYLKISFHVIFTLIVILGLGIFIQNIIPITTAIGILFSKILSILSPFFIGIAIAYLLDPVVDMYQKRVVEPLGIFLKKKNISLFKNNINKKNKDKETSRILPTLLTYLTLVLLLTLIGILLSRSLGNHKGFRNLDNLVNSIKIYVQSFNNMITNLQQGLEDIGFLQEAEEALTEFSWKLGSYVQNITLLAIEKITKAGNKVIDLALALVISFYLLKDKRKLLKIFNQFIKILLPEKAYNRLKYFWFDVDMVLSGYIRGQLTDSLIMGVLIGISVAIIGIDFPIIIGMIAGIANVIPYFGPIIGMIPAALMGLISDNPMKALYACITLLILQQIDGAIIAPKVVGESVDVHPVAVVVSILIGGSLFGLLGMLVAVPIAALVKLLLIRFMERNTEE